MKLVMVFILLIPLIQAHFEERPSKMTSFEDMDFPKKCYSRSDGAVHLRRICDSDRRPIGCLKENQIDKSDVKLIKYECESRTILSLIIYLDAVNVFTNLNVLDVSNLGIRSFDIVPNMDSGRGSCPNLKVLNASHNQLAHISESLFDDIPQILHIDYSYNQIYNFHSFMRHQNLKLKWLNLRNNPLKQLILQSSLVNLQTLDLCNTELYHLMLADGQRLKELLLDGSTISELDCDLISGLDLELLSVRNTQIEEIRDDCFARSIKMKELYMSGISLGQNTCNMFASLSNLQTLDVSNTMITEIDDECFVNNPKMKALNLVDNRLERFSFNAFSPKARLVEVHLPSESIEELDISCVNSICHFKQFDRNDFFQNVEIFNASGNRKQNIPRLLKQIGSKARNFDLSRTSIATLNNAMLKPFLNLRRLNLSQSQISKIENAAFIKQTKLISLDLSNNSLEDIDSVQMGLGSLKTLSLVGNKLTKLGMVNEINLPSLKTLKIAGNPFDSTYLYDNLNEWVENGLEVDVALIAPSTITTKRTTETTASTIQSSTSTSIEPTTTIPSTSTDSTSTTVLPIKPEDVPWYKAPYFIFSLIALVIVVLVIWQSVRGLCVYRNLEIDMNNFLSGDASRLNPELALDAQADLLPYDTKYEFPFSKLRLGKQIGAGSFGIVLEAMAEGIVAHEKETKVAVKMVKNITSNEVMRALISELKIMVHLGKHLNVVNLLGAVTKDIGKFELMVIVEYCPFGNLKSFLEKNRQYFVNQIVPGTDEIDFKLNSTYILTASACSWFDRNQVNNSTNPFLSDEFQQNSGRLVMTEGPTESPPHLVTTEDLLIWSFQIARGMDYLASRKVLHGDLAARNILLCDNNVVKICDFGLSRSLYKNEDYHYQMKTQRRLPLKWLALETLNDQLFSTYSDVWSYGIALWELFSLGQKPYAGVKIADMISKLNGGLRLEKPEYATQEIYNIMLSCWSSIPENRPKFYELEKMMSKLIGVTKSQLYIDLNRPYLKANANRFKHNKPDYLALLASPCCQAPAVPGMGV